MDGTNILYCNVPNGLIGALLEPLIPRHGAVFRAGTLLQVDYIGGIFRKGLPVIQRIALLNRSFKVYCSSLDGLLDLALIPGAGL